MWKSVGCVLVLLLAVSQIASCGIRDKVICQNLSLFYTLWKEAAFGMHPNRVERSAWIILNPAGFYESKKWPHSEERSKEIWKGRAPSYAVAIVHTHPNNDDERPSYCDLLTAKKLGIALYVISNKGIWSVDASGYQSKQADSGWYKPRACN